MQGLEQLAAVTREKLAAAATFRNYLPGEVVYRAGEPADGVFVVCHGGVKVIHPDRNANHFELACKPSVLGVPGVLSGSVYQFTAVVLVPSTIALIPAELFVEFVAEHPEAEGIGGFVTERYRRHLQLMV